MTAAAVPTAACYDRELEWNEPPSSSERRWARWTVVRAAGAPAAAWWPLARLGAVELYVAPPGTEGDAPVLYAEPVVARKRGRRRSGDHVGVDGQVATREAFDAGAPGPGGLVAALPAPPAGGDSSVGAEVRVAVIDVAFANVGALDGLVARSGGAAGADAGAGASVVEGPFLLGLTSDDDERRPPVTLVDPIDPPAGHGTVMAGIVLHEAPGARVGLFRIPSVAGAARPYLAAADLCAAVAAAVGGWRADVVLIAMSDGAWGTPRALRDVLREAARAGRGGRGAAIFCSVGDPSRNHARRIDSAALGADDLASQPWVQAVAACAGDGRWYRVYPDYAAAGSGAHGDGDDRAGGATYNRFGPAVALSASGEPRRFGPRIAADDSSQASALAAAAAAAVLRANPALDVHELRALLALTARLAPAVDGGRGLAAGQFDERDRLGHSLKLGHGQVDAGAAVLAAADPMALALLVTAPLPTSSPLSLAAAFHAAVGLAAARHCPLARAYLAAAPHILRAFFCSLAAKEALLWLARHLHALAAAPSAPGAATWWAPGQDHGALVERIRHAAEAVAGAVPVAEPAISAGPTTRFAALLDEALGDFGDPRAGAAAAAFVTSVVASLARRVALVRKAAALGGASLLDDEPQRGQT